MKSIALIVLLFAALLNSTTATPPVKHAGSDEQNERLLQQAHTFADAYNWTDAMPLFRKAEDGFKRSGNQAAQLEAHIGWLRVDPQVPISFRTSELHNLLVNSHNLEGNSRLRLFALVVLGDLDGEVDWFAARRDWTQVRSLAMQLGASKWIYRAEGQLGFTYFYQGDFSTCRQMVAQALVQATEAGDVGAEIFFLSTTANGYNRVKMFKEAGLYARRAIALSSTYPESGYPKIALGTLLESLIGCGQLKEATATLDHECARLPFGQCQMERALIARADGDIARAIKQYLEAIHQVTAIGENRAAADWQTGLAEVYFSSGDLVASARLESAAIASLRASGSISLLPDAMGLLADIMVRQGHFIDADRVFDEALTIQDAMLGKANTMLSKTAVITNSNSLYAKYFALAADHVGGFAKAYRIIEQARGRSLTDLLASGSVTSTGSFETERQISKLQLRLTDYHSTAEVTHIRDAVFAAEESRALNSGVMILPAKGNNPIDYMAVQRVLDNSEAVLEYVVAEPISYCIFLTRDDIGIVRLPGKNRIEELVSKYLDAVKAKQTGREEAMQLHHMLLEPVSKVRDAKYLIVVPDDTLHFLPFDALIDAHGKYLVQSKQVSYAPSSSTFYLLRIRHQKRAQPEAILAVGGVPYSSSDMPSRAIALGYSTTPVTDLPSSADEVRAFADSFRNEQNEVLLDDMATETEFKKAIATHTFRFVHLAVHAFAASEPDRAALMMLRDPHGRDDGFLQASEIVQMRINSKLVVLSACDTAVGPVNGEEGVSTLSNAFLVAGAQTVVSTLWSVNDSPTQFLLKRFYKNLAQQEVEPSEAMANAKREMLHTFGEKALPIYWAGFVVQGADRLGS